MCDATMLRLKSSWKNHKHLSRCITIASLDDPLFMASNEARMLAGFKFAAVFHVEGMPPCALYPKQFLERLVFVKVLPPSLMPRGHPIFDTLLL